MFLDYSFSHESKAAQQPTGTRQPTRAAAQTTGVGRALRTTQPIAAARCSKDKDEGPQDPPPAPIRASPCSPPHHGNATPEVQRGIRPARDSTTWRSTNATVTVPGHRELHHGEPRNLIHYCPAYMRQVQPSRRITGIPGRPSPQRVSQLRTTQSSPAIPTLSTPGPPKTYLDVQRQYAARDTSIPDLVPEDWDPNPGHHSRRATLTHLQRARNSQSAWPKPLNSVEDLRPRYFRSAHSWTGMPELIGGEPLADRRVEREAKEGLGTEFPLPPALRKRTSAPEGGVTEGCRRASAASDPSDVEKADGGKAPAQSRLRRAVSRVSTLMGQFGGEAHKGRQSVAPGPDVDDEDVPLSFLMAQKKAFSTSHEDIPLSVLRAQMKSTSQPRRPSASNPPLVCTTAMQTRKSALKISTEVSPASAPLPPSPLVSTPRTGQSTRLSTSTPPTATSSVRLSCEHSGNGSKRAAPLERTESSQTVPALALTAGLCSAGKRASPLERTASSQTMPSLTVATDPIVQDFQARRSVSGMESRTRAAPFPAPCSKPTAPARYRRSRGSILQNPSVCGSIAEVQDEDDESSTVPEDGAESFVTAREFTSPWGAAEESEEQAEWRRLREGSGTPAPPDGAEGASADENREKAEVVREEQKLCRNDWSMD